jgi:two-component system, NarL family, response regulator LiaR
VEEPQTSLRVVITDDDPLARQTIKAALQRRSITVIAEASNGGDAVALTRHYRPDVVLMDLVMPGMDGVEATRRIVAARPATRVIALTSFLEDDKVLPAVRAGAAGYLLKDVGPPELVRAIRTVHAGEALLHPAVAARVLEEVAASPGTAAPAAPPASAPRTDPGLTPREREVLELMARGLANKRIALELGIAEKTVKIHVSRILHKLGVADRTQAALYAVREGLA